MQDTIHLSRCRRVGAAGARLVSGSWLRAVSRPWLRLEVLLLPLALVLLVAGWQVLVWITGYPAFILPSPADVAAAGVRVIPYICGDVEEVLLAFNNGQLGEDGFLMPGRCGWRRRCRCRRHRPVSQETGQGVEDHESSNKRKGAGAE